MTAIRTRGLTKTFGGVTAVDDLDLRVESGEVFGFLGPNGAGKSTTIDLLLGFTSPTSGEATVLGRDVRSAGADARRDVGVLPEDYAVYDDLSAREHLRSMIRLKAVDDDPERLLETVGIDPADRDRPAGGFSKGMCQRLVLAVALAGDPDLLILDEPSSGLDPSGIAEIRDLVRAEAESGTTVFFSSHRLPQVEAVCDRVGIMDDGRLVAVDTVDGLRERTGGAERLRLSLRDPPTEETLARLGAVDGVVDVTAADEDVTVVCGEPGAKAEAVAAATRDAAVADFAVETTTLAELFERFTGADGDDPAATEPDTGPVSIGRDGGESP
jgi:ABC-2 type transport system ATP-binding protein